MYTIEANTSVSTLEQLQSEGYQLQGFPFINNSVELFSVKVPLTVERGSVCSLVFLDRDKMPIAATAVLR